MIDGGLPIENHIQRERFSEALEAKPKQLDIITIILNEENARPFSHFRTRTCRRHGLEFLHRAKGEEYV
jgi:hypothetical protein